LQRGIARARRSLAQLGVTGFDAPGVYVGCIAKGEAETTYIGYHGHGAVEKIFSYVV